jgi:hypothetical protein
LPPTQEDPIPIGPDSKRAQVDPELLKRLEEFTVKGV